MIISGPMPHGGAAIIDRPLPHRSAVIGTRPRPYRSAMIIDRTGTHDRLIGVAMVPHDTEIIAGAVVDRRCSVSVTSGLVGD